MGFCFYLVLCLLEIFSTLLVMVIIRFGKNMFVKKLYVIFVQHLKTTRRKKTAVNTNLIAENRVLMIKLS